MFLSGVLITGCMENKAVYHAYQHVEKEWGSHDTLFLEVAIPDSSNTYHTSILVRYQDTYPFENLILTMDYNPEDSLTWRNQTINIDLTEKSDLELSKWIVLRERLLPLDDIFIDSPRTVTFKITHRMGSNPLLGINDIGILMESDSLKSAVTPGINAKKDEQQDGESPQ